PEPMATACTWIALPSGSFGLERWNASTDSEIQVSFSEPYVKTSSTEPVAGAAGASAEGSCPPLEQPASAARSAIAARVRGCVPLTLSGSGFLAFMGRAPVISRACPQYTTAPGRRSRDVTELERSAVFTVLSQVRRQADGRTSRSRPGPDVIRAETGG